jgi:sarcosine oxidase subunit beta
VSGEALLIVGGGIVGLSIAYHLAKLGTPNVVVVERDYLCAGASGRNGGGVRAQWSSAVNVEIMQESLRLCASFARDHGINVWFRRGGYLFLTRDAAKASVLEESCKMQQSLGNRTELRDAVGARKIVPELATDGVVAAAWNPDDGVVFPWPFVWGYAQQASRLGAQIRTHTRVDALETDGRRITHARLTANHGTATPTTERLPVRAVVNAAGAWSPELAAMVGVPLPNRPHRHEICSTEPLKPWLGPLVADLDDGLYFSQSTRGEIVGGLGNDYAPHGLVQTSSTTFLARYGRSLVGAVPRLADVKVLRQWAGCYDLTPDQNPVFGPIDEIDGFFQASGFMGHGFMMAPVVGRLLAEHIATGQMTPLLERWNLRRFREGKLLSEAMIIG